MPIKYIRKDVDRSAKDTSGRFSEKQKLEAFVLYLKIGNIREVGRILNIDYNTLYKWKYSPWWKKQYQELELGNKVKFGSKISGILDKSVDKLDDLLDNGNYWFNFKTKTVERKPLTAKEVTEIMNTAVKAQESNEVAREAILAREHQEANEIALKARLEGLARLLAGVPTAQVVEVNTGSDAVVEVDYKTIEDKTSDAVQSGV